MAEPNPIGGGAGLTGRRDRYTRGVDARAVDLARLSGRFVVFEGPDGSGKTTQVARFAEACRDAGVALTTVREPGGTDVGERIRAILLGRGSTGLGMSAEMLLYMAARAQLVESVIRPALARGELVLADRFVASTIAYQGFAGGIDPDSVAAVGKIATGGLDPDLIVLLDMDESAAAARLGGELDRIESRGAAFHRKVRRSYLLQAEADLSRWRIVDANSDRDEVFGRVLSAVGSWLGSGRS